MLHQITFPVGLLACNCTILGDDATGESMVVDPGDQVAGIVHYIASHRWRLTAIVVTHAHIDHIGGAAELKRLTGAPVWLNSNDQELYAGIEDQAAWIGVPPPTRTAIDGDLKNTARLAVGEHAVEVIQTPGHTPGSVSLYLPAQGKLLAGDTLFAGAIGRTDLPGGDYSQIIESIRGPLLALPETTIVVPGHGEETTIGRERDTNPFLQD